MKDNWAPILWKDSQHETKIIWHVDNTYSIVWILVVYIQTAHIYQEKKDRQSGWITDMSS